MDVNSFFQTPIGQHGEHIKPKNLKHSWTKHGEKVNLGLQNRTPEWTCQICGENCEDSRTGWQYENVKI